VVTEAGSAGRAPMITPVQRPVPLRHSVYEALVELVVGGRLGPGEHLVETELARLAARCADTAAVARLRAIWREGEAAVAAGDTERTRSAHHPPASRAGSDPGR
jgi:DNA-binding GntR family transcriptional regulator